MANTYTLISSQVLTSGAATVTFSSIPQTYTDLVLKISLRNDSVGVTFSSLLYNLNNNYSSVYSRTYLMGSGAAASSARQSAVAQISLQNGYNGPSSTASTYGNLEIYIPSYTTSQNKPISNFNVVENNAATAYINVTAGLFSSTSPITQIIFAPSGDNFVATSSFYLYGIKNS